MWHAVNIVQTLALVVIAALLLWYAYQWQRQRSEEAAERREEEARQYEEEAPRRRHEANKLRIGAAGRREEEDVDLREAARANLKLLGVPDVEPGQIVTNVPCLDPTAEGGWKKERPVVTVSRAMIYTRQGTRPLEFIELGDGYAIWATGKATFLVKRYKLTPTQESKLESERKQAIESSDSQIPDFLGHAWEVKGAYGENYNPAADERPCSYIQVLGTHPKLGEAGIESVLPADVLDGEMHDYYDMQAVNLDEAAETDQILYFFYTSGAWGCFIGRKLDEPEVNSLRAA